MTIKYGILVLTVMLERQALVIFLTDVTTLTGGRFCI